MAGTTAEIVRLLRDRSLTLAECARILGLNRAQLDERLRMMERHGYLARATPQTDSCTCSGCCSSCGCSAKDTSSAPLIYSLTGKGERLAARE